MSTLIGPFIGSQALRDGVLTREQLRRRYRRLHPDVYLASHIEEPTLATRIEAAWLWSQRCGVVAGLAASALHGARWVDRDAAVELIHPNPRPPAGVITRRELILDGETTTLGEITLTSPARTGFDLGRRGTLVAALARLDALLHATGIPTTEIADVARRHPRARGKRRLETVLELADPGAQSPRESWLRLILVRAGLPRPDSQIPVHDEHGVVFAYLDLGWPDLKVAVEYDGDHHRSDRAQYVKDIRRREMLARMGWIVITVVAGDRATDIVARVRDTMARAR